MDGLSGCRIECLNLGLDEARGGVSKGGLCHVFLTGLRVKRGDGLELLGHKAESAGVLRGEENGCRLADIISWRSSMSCVSGVPGGFAVQHLGYGGFIWTAKSPAGYYPMSIKSFKGSLMVLYIECQASCAFYSL